MPNTEYNDLRIQYNSLFKDMTDIYHNIALKLEISDSAFLILYAIVELGCGCTQKDIAQMYYMSKQTINSSIKNLEKSGYITLKQDKGNNKQIFLTTLGEKLAQEKIKPVIKIENDVFAQMSFDESQKLLKLTRKYTDLLKEKTEVIL
mgnify:CR=1 FL=1